MKKLWQKLRSIDTNSIVAVSAVIISLCALLVSLQEVRLMRQQQKASMYPYLTIGKNYNAEGFAIYLRNSGSGLARINSVELTDGERYFSDWLDVLDFYLPDSIPVNYDLFRTNNINDQILTQGEQVRLFSMQWTPAIRDFEERTRDLDMIICYSSLLDDYWVLQSGKQRALLGPCDVNEEQQFR